jgi:hypothetical protein
MEPFLTVTVAVFAAALAWRAGRASVVVKEARAAPVAAEDTKPESAEEASEAPKTTVDEVKKLVGGGSARVDR